jgi:hypothetical protein
LKELTISNNPFINEVFGYKHLFINKYSHINKLDNESINDLDREIAFKFSNENNKMEKVRHTSSTLRTDTDIVMNRAAKVIDKNEYKPDKKTHPLKMMKRDSSSIMNSITDFNTLNNEMEQLRIENKLLADQNRL